MNFVGLFFYVSIILGVATQATSHAQQGVFSPGFVGAWDFKAPIDGCWNHHSNETGKLSSRKSVLLWFVWFGMCIEK